MILSIITIPNPILKKRSDEIGRDFVLSVECKNLIQNITETMYVKDGVGIAAPQIGQNIRMCIIGKEALKNSENEKSFDYKKDLALINPIWTKISKKTKIDIEGCLSVPDTNGKVKRYKDILVNAWNEKGEKITFEAHDFLARVIQHEIDHLDGILFTDRAKTIYPTK